MVPIEVGRQSCSLGCNQQSAGSWSPVNLTSKTRSEGKALAGKGYSNVNLLTLKGLRHQFISLELEEIMAFLQQVLHGSELPRSVPERPA